MDWPLLLLCCQDSRLRGNDDSLNFCFFQAALPAGGRRIRESDLRVSGCLFVF
ncbi:hypothetical protein HMPREF9418_0228 [Neisseria macacae ATCC 33926]|uniref:Uncharacterized protein n=1 Tax=Neisseria macacae ATCC 33926 TaxID=997348 RepID=A0AA36ULP5_9NEIS|nr:hypothetical protein HMPREF9418_0228 [Neisseria macacae ATCC 33926]